MCNVTFYFVMECNNFILNNVDKTLPVRTRRKFNSRTIYAGLIIYFVPLVLCDTDWSSSVLTFDKIYNNTNYAQIQYTSISKYKSHINPATYSISNSQKFVNSDEDAKGNDLEYEEYDFRDSDKNIFNKGQLLVGFSHDPYRYSVTEQDYMNGIREINPEMYKSDNRGKRGLLHLYNMILCATGCEPLSYKGYGCYCGFLGSGRPTDGIDRCCKMHDECYNILCPFYTVYFQPYYWKCYRGQPLCASENYRTQHQFINGCAAKLCECDRRYAMCVKRYRCPRRRALCPSSPLRLLQNLLMFK